MFDIHITCPLEQLLSMVEAFEAQFEAQREEVVVLDWGASCKKQEGYIVFEWVDEVDQAFIDHLTTASTILDFSIYSVPCVTDDPCYPLSFAAEGGTPQ